jgi:hypothetical protein
MAAGESFKQALRNGVKAAALAGVGTAAYGGITGTDVTSAGSYTGPKTLGETYDFYKGKVDSLLQTSPTEAVSSPGPVGSVDAAQDYLSSPDAQNLVQAQQAEGMRALNEGIPQRDILTPRPGDLDYSTLPGASPSPAPTTTAAGVKPGGGLTGTTPTGATAPSAGASGPSPSMWQRAKDFASAPSFDSFSDMLIDPNATTKIGRYGPLAATTLGVTALTGGFKGKEADPNPLFNPQESGLDYIRKTPDILAGSIGQSKTYDYPALVPTPGDFGIPQASEAPMYRPSGITSIPTAQGISQPYNVSGLYGIPDIYRPRQQDVYTAKRGSGPQGVTNFPRKTGPINGPGTGTSDSIPAMLSDGEFVFTAKSVRNMGNGSRRKGAARMYKLMKMLEGGPVGVPASKKG